MLKQPFAVFFPPFWLRVYVTCHNFFKLLVQRVREAGVISWSASPGFGASQCCTETRLAKDDDVSWVSSVTEVSSSFSNTGPQMKFRIHFMFIQLQCDRANAIWTSTVYSEVWIYWGWARYSHLISIASIPTFWAASMEVVTQEQKNTAQKCLRWWSL